jgi:hypothetical protein
MVYDIFERHVKSLPIADRLQLARLIMEDLAESAPQWTVEASDNWSQDDLYDLSRASLRYAA